MNFESRIPEMNQINNDHQMHNNSTATSSSLFDGHMSKYPISPMMNSSFNNARDETMRNGFDLWKMEMDRKVNIFFQDISFLKPEPYRLLSPKSSVMMH